MHVLKLRAARGGAILALALVVAGCRGAVTPTPSDTSQARDCAPPGERPFPQVQALGSRGTLNDIAVSPDGVRLVVGGEMGLMLLCADTLADIWYTPDALVGTNSVTLSPDGGHILSGDYIYHRRFPESYLGWHDAATGQLQSRLLTTTYPFRAFAYSPDGQWLAGATFDYEANTSAIFAWRAADGNPDPTAAPHLTGNGKESDLGTQEGEVQALGLSPDGKWLAGVFTDGRVLLWRVEGRKLADQTITAGAGDYQTTVQFAPDGKQVAVASPGAGLFVWEINGRGRLANLRRIPLLDIRDVAFRPGSQEIATGAARGLLMLWDLDSGALLRTYPASDTLTGVAFDPDGKWLYGSSLYAVDKWDVETGERVATRDFTPGSWITSLDFSPDGKTLAAGQADGLITLHDPVSGSISYGPYSGGSVVRRVAYSPDGRKLAEASFDGVTRVGGLEAGYWMCEYQGQRDTLIVGLAWSLDGQHIATGGHDGSLHIWNPTSCQAEQMLAGHPDMVIDLAFSPDGKWLASGSWDGTAAIWDAATSARVKTLEAKIRAVESVAWSPDGRTLAVGRGAQYLERGGSPVWLWDVDSGSVRNVGWSGETPYYWVRAVRWSPDGRLIAAAGGPDVHIWDATSGVLIANLTGHRGEIWALDWSPDGSTLATGALDGSLLLWDVGGIRLPGEAGE